MSPGTFDNEASPETLVNGGLDWKQWGVYCLVAAVAIFCAVAVFELGRAMGLDEARQTIIVEGTK